MTRALLPLMLLTQAGAASVDILPRLYADGVFRSATSLPDAQVPRGAQGVRLLPAGFGGEWTLILSGPKVAAGPVTGAHLTYAGTAQGFAQNVPAVAKLSGRVGATLAAGCFAVGTDRLSALRAWVEEKVRAGGSAQLNTERSFGPLRVQVLAHHTPAGEQTAGQAEVDVILTRAGTPGSGGWAATCQPGKP